MKFNPWPIGLVAWFAFFIGIIVWFVIQSLGMNHDLVVQDYYAEGLHHEDRMIALARTRALENPPRIENDWKNHRLIVHTPGIAQDPVFILYRPSDSSMDLKFALQPGGEPSVVETANLHPGKWQAKIKWATNGVEYYHQEDLFIQ
jgi:nitrogen fixation protein FixH